MKNSVRWPSGTIIVQKASARPAQIIDHQFGDYQRDQLSLFEFCCSCARSAAHECLKTTALPAADNNITITITIGDRTDNNRPTAANELDRPADSSSRAAGWFELALASGRPASPLSAVGCRLFAVETDVEWERHRLAYRCRVSGHRAAGSIKSAPR